MRSAHLLGCLVLVASACGRDLRGTPRLVLAGTPELPRQVEPFACVSDADCASGPLVDPANGCCDTGVHRGVFARSYLAWRARWVKERCASVECAPQPPPAPPRACALQGRCAAGRCEGSCEAPRTGQGLRFGASIAAP